MKINITILIILLCAFCAFAQKPTYVNEQYNFSFVPPVGSKLDNELNDVMKFLVTYSCLTDCPNPGFFSISSVLPLTATNKQIVKTFQHKPTQDGVAQKLISALTAETNPTVLSKSYAAYFGRPAFRVDFNFVQNNISLNGRMVQLFVEERNILVVFSFVAPATSSDKWIEISEEALRSFALSSKNKLSPPPPPPVPREGIRTIIGTDNINSQDATKKVSGGILNGKATSLPAPVYPAAARAVRAEGLVNVQVTLDEEGNVVSASAVSGHPLLRKAAEDAARGAKFKPTVLSGQKVRVIGVIVYNFVR